jgi:hypothetical protein
MRIEMRWALDYFPAMDKTHPAPDNFQRFGAKRDEN